GRRGVAQSGSALAWGASGRRFKSCRPDHGPESTDSGPLLFSGVLMTLATPGFPLPRPRRRRRIWDRWMRVENTVSETHRVTTADGTRLNMVRVHPAGSAQMSTPVMLLHGLASNRHTFHFPDRSLASFLAGHGFDCWVPEL